MTDHTKINRDIRGRWSKGTSGNPSGKSKKPRPAPPDNFADMLRSALQTKVRVNQGGKVSFLTAEQALATSLVKECLSASGADKLRYLSFLVKLLEKSPRSKLPEESERFWKQEQEDLFQELLRVMGETDGSEGRPEIDERG